MVILQRWNIQYSGHSGNIVRRFYGLLLNYEARRGSFY
jgi:hypothetical protein